MMKLKPIPAPEPVIIPANEPEGYALKHPGDVLPAMQPIFEIIAEKLTPLFEKYEFDFLGGAYYEPGTHSNPFTNYLPQFDGGGVLYGSAQIEQIGGEYRVINGAGSLTIMLFNDIEGPDLMDFAQECAAEIDKMTVTAYAGGTPIHCKKPRFRNVSDIAGRGVDIIEMPFVFGWKLLPRVEFVHADRVISPDEIAAIREINAFMDRTPLNY